MHTVHVRINDAATGQPTPVRVRFTDRVGRYYAPFGRLTEFATGSNQDVGGNLRLGSEAFAYIDGSFEINLPAGPIHVKVHKGPEYQPLQCETVLAQGKLALRYNIERSADLRKQGWYSGDTRAHFLSPHAALLEGMAEDLAVVNLLAAECQFSGSRGETFPTIPNILAFSGQSPILSKAGTMVVVNTHNTHPVLGHLALLNCHRVVYPLRIDGATGKEDWTLADWCDQCHRKKGLVVWTHGPEAPRWGEALADAILGKVDALELSARDSWKDRLADWYTLLNSGVRLPLVGASGKDSNTIPLGLLRTYARLVLGEEFNYQTWIEAVRAGRTIVTTGPFLLFTAANREPGAVIQLQAAEKTVRVRAEVSGSLRGARLEIIANGEVAASQEASGASWLTSWEGDIPVPAGGWLAARCRSAIEPENNSLFVHTSPVYLAGYQQESDVRRTPVAELLGHLRELYDSPEHMGRFNHPPAQKRLLSILDKAEHILKSQ
jgi:hypothetical protein